MSFQAAASFYKKIYQFLTNKCSTAKDLIPLIVDELSKPRGKMLILVLDEIDILDSRHQEMLYTIFNLPRYKSTKVIIIGIANTLDFTSKTLTRLHRLDIDTMKEIAFQPYDQGKIAAILRNRISKLTNEQPLFQEVAIELCARKVASLSGDVRKALEIMRRSIELVEQEANQTNRSNLLREQNQQQLVLNGDLVDKSIKMVTISHVAKILSQVLGSKFEEVAQDDYSFPVQQKIVLSVLLLLSSEGAKQQLDLGKCYDRFRRITKDHLVLDQLEINSTNIFLDMCEMLESKGFIAIQKSKDIRCTKLSLLVSQEETKDLLKSNQLCRSILI